MVVHITKNMYCYSLRAVSNCDFDHWDYTRALFYPATRITLLASGHSHHSTRIWPLTSLHSHPATRITLLASGLHISPLASGLHISPLASGHSRRSASRQAGSIAPADIQICRVSRSTRLIQCIVIHIWFLLAVLNENDENVFFRRADTLSI